MSTAENKAIIRRFFDELNAGQLDMRETDLLDAGYQLHFDSLPTLDRTGAAQVFGMFLSAFPGIQHTIEDQVAEGDKVASRIVVRGTHGAEFQGIPPTGKEIAITAMNIHRVSNGKIVEHWINSDSFGMLQQLGVIPAPEGAAT